MEAIVLVAGNEVYNPSTGEMFKVKDNQYLVVWHIPKLMGDDLAILAISVPFTNHNSADEASQRLSTVVLAQERQV